MKPLEPDDEVVERSGWCKMGDAFDLELRGEDVFWDDHINLGFRTDRWAIPPQLLRAKMKEAETQYLEKKGRERMGRAEKKELKELVVKRLRRTLTPVTRAIDFSWSPEEGIVRFFSQAAKPALAMTDVFEKTFTGLKLIPEAPFTLAQRASLGKKFEAAWDALEPTSFEEFGEEEGA